MAKIENYKYTIEQAFRDCFYIVPDYQREYVWSDREVHQLLDDINEQLGSAIDKEYFIGMVLVSEIAGHNGHFEVIDGQQRLTTFFLLLCALRHLFQGEKQHQILNNLISTSYTTSAGDMETALKFNPCYDNASELMQQLVVLDSDPQTVVTAVANSGIRSFGSLENLLNAYGTIHRYLQENYAEAAELRRFWGYLANNVVFIQISTDVSSALKIFETINERGVGLNPMDLLKNLLFTQVNQQEFTRLKNEWKKITSPLEKAKEKPLRFLRYYLMANYAISNERKDYIVREDEIYDWFTNKANAALCAYEANPFEFVRKVVRNVELYLNFTKGFANDGEPSLAMDNLKRLCGGAFSLHYVLLLAVSNLPRELFDYFVHQLESFLFYYIFTKTPTKELERNFSLWADELREIATLSNEGEQRGQLSTFIEQRFQKNMANKQDSLNDLLKRYGLYSMQKYRTRYLLAKLTQYVDMAYLGAKTQGSLQDYFKLEIEHILPDNPKLELRAAFQQANPDALYDECKNRLGNLTLLEKPINIVAGNDFYEKKLPEYQKCKNYLTSSLSGLMEVGSNTSISRINQKLRAFDTWSAHSIDERQAMLAELIGDIWRVELLD